MSDRFYQASISKLLSIIIREYKTSKSIFGITEELFFVPSKDDPFKMNRYGQLLETPLGVAAGPHTQMAQNIIAAWLTGARFIELKTVQTLDEIEVAKPCIDIEDEGYNCEWSQELKLQQSFEEYLKAWIIIHVLRDIFKWKNDSNNPGIIFNMSVGYSLEGILNENVQTFLKNMKDADPLISQYINEASEIYPAIKNIYIPTKLSDNLTLSTMHGCPPEEIEKIGLYLIETLKLHTTIKLNPTLLGPETLRGILNDNLGFSAIIPDIAFEHDLKYKDAISILNNLIKASAENSVDFAVKLTNTLEAVNSRGIFDASQEMNYMSGRALHPLSISLAKILQTEFKGELDISLSGGGDAFNVVPVLKAGIKPITVCSDLLKPGGYGRMKQYINILTDEMKKVNANSLDELIIAEAKSEDIKTAALDFLKMYGDQVLNDEKYQKETLPWPSIKSVRKLNLFDCIEAPCVGKCPTHQDIPLYCGLTAEGRFDNALEIIRWNNPFPFSTGYACDHKCQDKCTRSNYDVPIRIREIKRFVAESASPVVEDSPNKTINKKVAIIGGGPGGLSAAHYLAKSGFSVTVFEKREKVGGMLVYALPQFRLPIEGVEKDINLIKNLGVQIICNHNVDSAEFMKIKSQFDYIHISVGAQLSKEMNFQDKKSPQVLNFLSFLNKVESGEITSIPKKSIIIGGGNSAMDAARTAWRLSPSDGEVSIVYRRTQKQMPADIEEIKGLVEEGILIKELLSPTEAIFENGKLVSLKCNVMELGKPDESGRRRPVPVDDKFEFVEAELIIVAIGQNTDLDFLKDTEVELTKWGTILVKNDNCKTSEAHIYSGGDVVHGPNSIIQAIADGKDAAFSIMEQENIELPPKPELTREVDFVQLKVSRATRAYPAPLNETDINQRKNFNMVVDTMANQTAKEEGERCLSCDILCNVCVTVCPNRANIGWNTPAKSYNLRDMTLSNGSMSYGQPYKFEIKQIPQVLNIGDFCNECGNCTTFCPTSGQPFMDKPKFYLSQESFDEETTNAYMLLIDGDTHTILCKNEGNLYTMSGRTLNDYYDFSTNDVQLKLSVEDFSIRGMKLGSAEITIPMDIAAGMSTFIDASLLTLLLL
jgi:putative selenate reductase